MSVLTYTTVTPPRRLRALSLVAARTPPLLNLPNELVIEILELSLRQSRPSSLAIISKAISTFIETILYRTVVLHSKDAVALFHRTAQTKSKTFLATYVKKLVVTWNIMPHSLTSDQLWEIMAACVGLRSLILPSGYHPLSVASILRSPDRDGLCELTLQAYDEEDELGRCTSMHYLPFESTTAATNEASLTHLRICEPSVGWSSPSCILESFGPLPHITHLQLSRRINANEENDLIFMEDVRDILHCRTGLKVLIVTIFKYQSWGDWDVVEDSSIWQMMRSIAEQDPRLLLIQGSYGEWMDPYLGSKHFAPFDASSNFWAAAEQTAAQAAIEESDRADR